MPAPSFRLPHFSTATLLLTFLWLLFACGYAESKLTFAVALKSWQAKAGFPIAAKSWQAEVDGVQVMYHLVDLKGLPTLAYIKAALRSQRCHIYLDNWLLNSRSELMDLVLHEVGHCIDVFKLGFDHNGMSWGDCTEDEHTCRPEERYAEAWRESYLNTCGSSLNSLGFPDEDPHVCTLPDARAVPPETRVIHNTHGND